MIYRITKHIDYSNGIARDIYLCEVSIQDGIERWQEHTKENAIAAVIKSARILNGVYINLKDINIDLDSCYNTYALPLQNITPEENQILNDIRIGKKVVLNASDKRVKYEITDEECDYVLTAREQPKYWTNYAR